MVTDVMRENERLRAVATGLQNGLNYWQEMAKAMGKS